MAFDLDEAINKEFERNEVANGAAPIVNEDGGTPPAVPAAPPVTNEPVVQPPAAVKTEGNAVIAPDDKPVVPADNNNPDLFISRLEVLSGGRYKSEADLLSAFEKANQFDTVKPEYDTLKAKPVFADEFEQKRSELKLAGASKEVLKTFEKLNDLGDLTKLDAIEAKVMKLVLVDGYSERLARAEIAEQFPIESTYDEDQKANLQEKLDLSSKKDLEHLEKFKVEISTPAADANLKSVVDTEQLKSQLKPVFEDFNSRFNSLKTINLNDGKGEQAVTMDLAVDADGKAFLTRHIQDFMVENGLPLTQENYNDAMAYARKEYISENLDKVTKDVWKKAEEHFDKFYTEKYENLNGVPRSDRKPINKAAADEERAFKKEMGVDLSKA